MRLTSRNEAIRGGRTGRWGALLLLAGVLACSNDPGDGPKDGSPRDKNADVPVETGAAGTSGAAGDGVAGTGVAGSGAAGAVIDASAGAGGDDAGAAGSAAGAGGGDAGVDRADGATGAAGSTAGAGGGDASVDRPDAAAGGQGGATPLCGVGQHLCGAQCALNTSLSSCGPSSCTPCVPPAHGTSTCSGTACGFACDATYHACGQTCALNASTATCGASCTPCAPPAHATSTCGGVACDFTCDAGYHRVTSACVANDTTACCGPGCSACTATRANSTATCGGLAAGCTTPSPCVAGFHDCGGTCSSNAVVATCGASCTACPDPDHGAPTCNGTMCGIACDAGYHLCGALCVADNGDANCGTSCTACPTTSHGKMVCAGTPGAYACTATACDANYHFCKGAAAGTGFCAVNTNISACVVCNSQAPDPNSNPCSTCARSTDVGCNQTCGYDPNNLPWVAHTDATGLCEP
jgi:hypothetical protein